MATISKSKSPWPLTQFDRFVLRRIAANDRLASAPNGAFYLILSGKPIPPKTARRLLRERFIRSPAVPMFPNPNDGTLTPSGRAALEMEGGR
jgi:hypothetical protein